MTDYKASKRIIGTSSERTALTTNPDTLGTSANGTNTGITNPNYSSDGIYLYSGDYIEANGLQSTFTGATTVSVSAWIKMVGDNTDTTIVSMWGGTSNDVDKVFDIHVNGSSKLELSLRSGSTNYITTGTTTLNQDTLYHVAFTYDGSSTTVKLYLNGSEEASDSSNPSSLATGTGSSVLFGIYGDKSSNPFIGNLKQILVYSDVLTSSEITTLYNSGTPVTSPSTSGLVSRYDLTANANDSQGSNNGTASAIKLGTGAYSFDGSNDYVTVGSTSDWNFVHDGSGATVSAWVYRNGSQTGNGGIFVTEGGQSTTTGFGLGIRSGGNAYARTINTSNQWQVCEDTSSSVSTGVWHHILATIDSSSIKLYVDGTLNSSHTISGTLKSGNSSYNAVGRAYSGSAWSYLNGNLDDMGVWNRVLTATEIEKLANNNTSASQGWTESSGNVTIDGANTEMDFSIESGGNTAKAYYDLTSTSDTSWVLRIEDWNLSTLNTYGAMWIGLSSITSMDWANTGSSILMRLADFGDGDDYIIADSFNNSTTRVEGSAGRPALSTGTNYNLELIRDGTTITAKIFTTDFTGTPLATSTDTISGTTGLRYLVVENYYNTGSGNTNTNMVGTIQAIKFWNSTTTASGDPTYSTTFTAGDAQLVSSLSDTSGLKAYYSMDTNNSNTCPNDAVKVNPNTQSNSIWEESNTGKHYIWNGTAWTEVA